MLDSYSLIRPLLFALDPETAHRLVLLLLKQCAAFGLTRTFLSPTAPRSIMGLTFPNPVGLAAGLDKDGTYIDGLAALGLGAIEIGTITPHAQPGHPKPRLFRLPTAQAIINRMGFNNSGVDTCISHIQASQFYQDKQGILGINIGKNASTPISRATEDYLYCLEKIYPYADYIAINISSPNTRALRQLQNTSELDSLLAQIKQAQSRLADQYQHYTPIALKIAPDMDSEQVKQIADTLLRHKMDGVIATNTTTAYDMVKHLQQGTETGGLSGAPLYALSNRVICELKAELGDHLPIIGVGGILSGHDAQQKIQAGATMVQLYTGLIYRGPALIKECVAALADSS